MPKLYYLTRSYLPQQSGGILIRVGAVNFLRKNKFKVIVVTPNYGSREIRQENDILYLPLSYHLGLAMKMERIGFNEDYLDEWVKITFDYLKNKVTKEDIIFTTSGGELGNIKLGYNLKGRISCKLVINLQDPIDYTLVNGLKLDNSFHVSREKQEAKYLNIADLIITSSETLQISLQKKYPHLRDKIVNNYFGYIDKVSLIEKIPSTKLRIAYGGIFASLQSPEILAQALESIEDIEVYFIGDSHKYKPLKHYFNRYHFISFLPREEFLKFMLQQVDVGFVSLANDYLGACVPSKIYEYINLGIPILAALPEGSAKDIINNYKYGVACDYNDLESIRKAIIKLKDPNELDKFRRNILKDRDSWAMEERIKEVVNWLRNL